MYNLAPVFFGENIGIADSAESAAGISVMPKKAHY